MSKRTDNKQLIRDPETGSTLVYSGSVPGKEGGWEYSFDFRTEPDAEPAQLRILAGNDSVMKAYNLRREHGMPDYADLREENEFVQAFEEKHGRFSRISEMSRRDEHRLLVDQGFWFEWDEQKLDLMLSVLFRLYFNMTARRAPGFDTDPDNFYPDKLVFNPYWKAPIKYRRIETSVDALFGEKNRRRAWYEFWK